MSKNRMDAAGERPSLLATIRRMRRDSDQPTEEDIERVTRIIHTQEEVEQTRCGIGSFRPQWLQVLARKEVYLALYSMVAVAQGMFGTYNVAVTSTLEKRFKLSSKQMGIILSGNDISQVVLAIFLGYFGTYGNRPRWVGIGVIGASMACFFAALPHLVYGQGQAAIDILQSTSTHINLTDNALREKKVIELCYSKPQGNCSDEDGSGEVSYLGPVAFIFISQLIVGASFSTFWSIGITYLDDNLNKKTYPLYYAISLLMRMLGPVLGFMVGGKCLSLWIDPRYHPNLSQKDPRWLGAWWLGFLIIGCLLVVLGFLFLLFPHTMPATHRRRAKRVLRQAKNNPSGDGKADIQYFASLAHTKKLQAEKPNIRNLLKALRRLLTNKIWMANLFNTLCAVLAYGGYFTFKPKYIENQFRKSASESNYYTGVASMSSLVIGTALGGIVMRWLRPRPRIVTGYNTFLTLFYSIGITSLIFIGCPKLDLQGPYPGSSVPDCSSDCGCSEQFSPMCSQDGSTVLYSPCVAGCTQANTSHSPITFSDCQCIGNATNNMYGSTLGYASPPIKTPVIGVGGWGVSGYCDETCSTFFYYLIAQIIIKSVWATGKVAASMINLRTVRDEDKGLALGTLTVCVSFFGFIPSPIIMGAFIDSACLVWDNSCGKTGNCWFYDTDKIRLYQHLIPAIFNFLSLFGDMVVFYYSPQIDFYGDKEDEVPPEAAFRMAELTKKNDKREEEEEGTPEEKEKLKGNTDEVEEGE